MSDAFQRRSSPDIGQTFGINRGLGRERPKDCGGKMWVPLKQADQHGKGYRRDDDIGQRTDRVQRALEKACRKADKIPGKRDVQDLAPAIAEDPMTDRNAVDHHEKCVVSPSLRDDFAIAPDQSGVRLEALQYRNFFGREID